jgi:hypothetical protein
MPLAPGVTTGDFLERSMQKSLERWESMPDRLSAKEAKKPSDVSENY